MNNTRTIKTVAVGLSIIAVVAVVSLIILNVFGSKETYITDGGTTAAVSSLDCRIITPKDAFFYSDEDLNATSEVKATLVDDKFDKISFVYTGTFADNNAAKVVSSAMHADYNIYMNGTPIDFSELSPNFSVIGNQVVINLFLTTETLTTETAKLIFLSASETSKIKNYSGGDLKKLYTDKGFSCNLLQ